MLGENTFSRRRFVAGAMALAAAGGHAGAEAKSPLAHGVLEDNELALAFAPFDTSLPDITLTGSGGDKHFSDYKGKTLLLSVWAEWCTPCMSELSDFGRLQRIFGNSTFQILPVLSGTKKQITPPILAEIFGHLHAESLEPVIEGRFGDRLMQRMARQSGGGVAIPCNLVVAPSGLVIARETGTKPLPTRDNDPIKSLKGDAYRDALLGRAEAGVALTLWGTTVGDTFAGALARGFLAGL